jgi:hypothetical protein
MSTIFYKFKIAKDYNSVKFDGTGLSVFDIKKEIMTAKKLGKGMDFDLVLINPNTDEGTCGHIPNMDSKFHLKNAQRSQQNTMMTMRLCPRTRRYSLFDGRHSELAEALHSAIWALIRRPAVLMLAVEAVASGLTTMRHTVHMQGSCTFL